MWPKLEVDSQLHRWKDLGEFDFRETSSLGPRVSLLATHEYSYSQPSWTLQQHWINKLLVCENVGIVQVSNFFCHMHHITINSQSLAKDVFSKGTQGYIAGPKDQEHLISQGQSMLISYKFQVEMAVFLFKLVGPLSWNLVNKQASIACLQICSRWSLAGGKVESRFSIVFIVLIID